MTPTTVDPTKYPVYLTKVRSRGNLLRGEMGSSGPGGGCTSRIALAAKPLRNAAIAGLGACVAAVCLPNICRLRSLTPSARNAASLAVAWLVARVFVDNCRSAPKLDSILLRERVCRCHRCRCHRRHCRGRCRVR